MIANPYTAPEEDLAHMQRERKTKLTLVVVGLVAAMVTLLGASALMYNDDAAYQPSATDAP